jgi:hypothetical protein
MRCFLGECGPSRSTSKGRVLTARGRSLVAVLNHPAKVPTRVDGNAEIVIGCCPRAIGLLRMTSGSLNAKPPEYLHRRKQAL